MDETIPLPAELEFLREANTAAICRWLYHTDEDVEDLQGMYPTVWSFFEKRIRQHPDEAGQANGMGSLPIHDVFSRTLIGMPTSTVVPLSLVKLLIEKHLEGLHTRGVYENIHLHLAMFNNPIECFRAVLYSGSVEATTTQNIFGYTPLHESTWEKISLGPLWELLCYNRDCASVQSNNGMTALEVLEGHPRYEEFPQTRNDAKEVMLKLAVNHNYVPKIPSDESVFTEVESHPACGVLAPKLEPGKDDFVLHHALTAKCPLVLVEALFEVFPNQACLQQEDACGRLPLHIALQSGAGASVRLLASTYPAAMNIADPVTGLLPIEQALLNAARDGSLDNTDAVDSLLRADPAFLSRHDAWRSA